MRLSLELGSSERSSRHADHEASPGVHAGGEVVRRVARRQDATDVPTPVASIAWKMR